MNSPGRIILSGCEDPILTIASGDRLLVSLHLDGRVEYHEELNPDEAARTFWEAMSFWAPVAQYRRELERLRQQAEMVSSFDAWWDQQVAENGGVEMGADFRHWAAKGYEAALAQNTQGAGEAVAVVDAGEDGMFVEILYGPDGSPLKVGDKLYLPAERARVPEGWVLVPREPTPEMVEAFHLEDGESASNKWNAMLSASPAPSPARVDGGEG